MGVVILQPGQSFPNHRHNIACEVFYTLSGEVCLYLEGTPHLLQAGDVLQCEPGRRTTSLIMAINPGKAYLLNRRIWKMTAIPQIRRPGNARLDIANVLPDGGTSTHPAYKRYSLSDIRRSFGYLLAQNITLMILNFLRRGAVKGQ